MPNNEKINTNLNISSDYLIKPINLAGGWPMPYLKLKNYKELFRDAPRIVINTNIKSKININNMLNGGLKIPHLHMEQEIVLLDKPLLKEYFSAVANEIDNIKEFNDIKDFVK